MHIKYTYITWLDCLFLWILVVQTVVGSVFAHIDYRDNMNHNAKRYWGDKVRKLTVVCLMNYIRLKLKQLKNSQYNQLLPCLYVKCSAVPKYFCMMITWTMALVNAQHNAYEYEVLFQKLRAVSENNKKSRFQAKRITFDFLSFRILLKQFIFFTESQKGSIQKMDTLFVLIST